MKTKVYFRVDATKSSGLGHLIRCIALAEILKGKFNCVFISRIDDENVLDIMENTSFKYQLISTHLDIDAELIWMKEHIFSTNEILVLDGYHFDADYQLSVKPFVGKVISIDDIHDTFFHTDAVINHGGGIQASDYQKNPKTRLFLGLDYLMLRKDFFKVSSVEIKQPYLENIMICLGGEDMHNESLEVLKQCEKIKGKRICHVVLGNANKHWESIDAFRQNTKMDVRIYRKLSARDMSRLMQECDTAICPPSTVALEYLVIGGNLFLHQTADNQKYLQDYLLKEKLAFPVKYLETVSIQNRHQALSFQKQKIDGKSPERLLNIFKELDMELLTNARKATQEDLDIYFDWANDAQTRKQSFNSEYIPFDQHVKWFIGKMASQTCKMYIFELDGIPAGQIRFDISHKVATISYSLAEPFRGKGLSKWLLKNGIQAFQKETPNISNIIGHVKTTNTPSIRTFKKLGFHRIVGNHNKLIFQQQVS